MLADDIFTHITSEHYNTLLVVGRFPMLSTVYIMHVLLTRHMWHIVWGCGYLVLLSQIVSGDDPGDNVWFLSRYVLMAYVLCIDLDIDAQIKSHVLPNTPILTLPEAH